MIYGGHCWDAYSATQATEALSSGESEFYATGSACARGLQAKSYLMETGRPFAVRIHSDSSAGRGMCQRVGVGKVRHIELRFLWIQERLRLKAFLLEKKHTDDMTADILTKYCEWPRIAKHCRTLNLRFATPEKGLSTFICMAAPTLSTAAKFGQDIVSLVSSKKTTSDGLSVSSRNQSWFPAAMITNAPTVAITMMLVLAAFLIGFGCGWIARWWFASAEGGKELRGTGDEAVQTLQPSPVPADAVGPAPAEACRVGSEQSGVNAPAAARAAPADAAAGAAAPLYTETRNEMQARRVSQLMAFLQAELKQLCSLHRLKVSGNKSELVARLLQLEYSGGTCSSFHAKFYTREQTYCMDKLRQAALAAGLKRNFGFRDVSTEAAAQH